MKESHVFDPKDINILEAENRKIWQNPEEILDAIELKRSYVAADLGVEAVSSPFLFLVKSKKSTA